MLRCRARAAAQPQIHRCQAFRHKYRRWACSRTHAATVRSTACAGWLLLCTHRSRGSTLSPATLVIVGFIALCSAVERLKRTAEQVKQLERQIRPASQTQVRSQSCCCQGDGLHLLLTCAPNQPVLYWLHCRMHCNLLTWPRQLPSAMRPACQMWRSLPAAATQQRQCHSSCAPRRSNCGSGCRYARWRPSTRRRRHSTHRHVCMMSAEAPRPAHLPLCVSEGTVA